MEKLIEGDLFWKLNNFHYKHFILISNFSNTELNIILVFLSSKIHFDHNSYNKFSTNNCVYFNILYLISIHIN